MSTTRLGILAVAVAGVWLVPGLGYGQPAPSVVDYHISIPKPQHRSVQVDVVFSHLEDRPLRVRMSSASPGRYARHEFAKNIIELQAFDANGREITASRDRPQIWTIRDHGGTARIRYRLFGDRVDGTYVGVDPTHAHLNMPAALLWAEGLEHRPARITFHPPPGTTWNVATQLFPTQEPYVFTAPNLQYLLDSPAELSDFEIRTFTGPALSDGSVSPTFRVVVHHDGLGSGVDAFANAVEVIVREALQVFGEFPRFETGTYTVIADYLPSAASDAMEHRNSTVVTGPVRLDTDAGRRRLLPTVAHEFFHAWNVERIRPASLEPFDFTDANISGELWFAEGFTNYYGELLALRAGIADLDTTVSSFSTALNIVLASPGRTINSPVAMSRMAPFVDAAVAVDRTNFANTYVSYYTWGEVIALGLDLTLRARSNGRITLDDYMRALWHRFGRSAGAEPGTVDRPYTLVDLRDVLGEVAGDTGFAERFFTRFVAGRDVMDDPLIYARAGLALRRVSPARSTLGRIRLGMGLSLVEATPFGSPLYEAGLDRDDVIRSLDGRSVQSASDIAEVLRSAAPGTRLQIGFERLGKTMSSVVTLAEDPTIELRAFEAVGLEPTDEQLAFRAAWLGSQQ